MDISGLQHSGPGWGYIKKYVDDAVASATFVDGEVPTGAMNESNKDFVLANTPSPATSLRVFLNGQRLKLTDDYTLSTATITLNTAPMSGELLICDYRY